MVKLLLSLKADLENVTDLAPSSDSFEFFFQVLEMRTQSGPDH